MPNIMSIAMGAAAVGGFGYLGAHSALKRTATEDPAMSQSERHGYATQKAIQSIGLGLAGIGLAKMAGFKGIARAATGAGKGLYGAAKVMTANPIRGVAKKLGFGGIKTFGVLAALAIPTAAVGAVAYGASRPGEPTSYGSMDQYGGTQYNQQSVKERMGMLGAMGDMVFGLNNLRHG